MAQVRTPQHADNWLSLPTISTAAVQVAEVAAAVQDQIIYLEQQLHEGTRFALAQIEGAHQAVLDQEEWVLDALDRAQTWQRLAPVSRYKQAMLAAMVHDAVQALGGIARLAELVPLLPLRRPPMYRPRRGTRS